MSTAPNPRGRRAPATAAPLPVAACPSSSCVEADAWPAWTDLPVDLLDLDKFTSEGHPFRRHPLGSRAWTLAPEMEGGRS